MLNGIQSLVNEFKIRKLYNLDSGFVSMADWHLKEVRQAMERSGWRFVAEHPGDGYRISATWEMARDDRTTNILIDFGGLDDMMTLPIEQSYGCSVRDRRSFSIYFSRKGEKGSQARELWLGNLKNFVQSLDQV